MPHQIMWSWYTGRWCMDCYIWYSKERTRRGSVAITILLWFVSLWPLKG